MAVQTKSVVEVPENTYDPSKVNAAFVAMVGECQLYKGYHGNISEEKKNGWYPVVLMMHRWDGRVGFPGGTRDPEDKDFKETAVREVLEEAGTHVLKEKLQYVIGHDTGKVIIHLYKEELGRVTQEFLRTLMHRSAGARDAVAEGFAFWAHLADYGYGRGVETLLGSNTLVCGVKEELLALLGRSIPELCLSAP